MGFQEAQQATYLDKMVTIRNISDKQFTAMWGGENYVINAGTEETVPMWLGRHLMRHAHQDNKTILELIENVKVSCGVCHAEFEDKRQLGAHSLSHRKQTASKE